MADVDLLLQFDDESFALQLQLEEIEAQREHQSGKWSEDNPPDYALAFDDFEAELNKTIMLVGDLKLAHSIAKAVDSDSLAIEGLRAEETMSVQDRIFAQSLKEAEDEVEDEDGDVHPQHTSRLPEALSFGTESWNWDRVLRATSASTLSVDSYAPLQARRPFTPSAREQSLSMYLNSRLDAVCVESPYTPILPCDWYVVMYTANRASRPFSCVPPRMKPSSHRNVTANLLNSR